MIDIHHAMMMYCHDMMTFCCDIMSYNDDMMKFHTLVVVKNQENDESEWNPLYQHPFMQGVRTVKCMMTALQIPTASAILLVECQVFLVIDGSGPLSELAK